MNVNDIVAVAGPRVPNSGLSQKSFRVATIVVSEQPLDAYAMSLYDWFARRAEGTKQIPCASGFLQYTCKPFNLATGGRGTMITRLADALPNGFTVTPTALRFGATKAGDAGALLAVTPAQDVTLTFTSTPGGWTAVSNQSWLQITKASGSGNGRFTAAVVNPGNVIAGQTSLAATITVTPAASGNYPLAIPATLTVDQTGGVSTAGPFGSFDTPVPGGGQGSIA